MDSTCIICSKKSNQLRKSRCKNCYEYLRRTGEERPKSVYSPEPPTCSICGKIGPRENDSRCKSCYRFWLKNGLNRPKHLCERSRLRQQSKKRCSSCSNVKDISQFPLLIRSSGNARLSFCSECKKAGQSPWLYRRRDSVKVKRQEDNRRRRALKRCSSSEKFSDLEIFERDGWVCQICKNPVDKKKSRMEPLGATIDHIIPVSVGGNHVRLNVRLAHRRCNEVKQAKALNDQFILFG